MSKKIGRRSNIARRSRIGLALGSGSARGWAHIGILEALDEGGIRPDVVCGCSIGALVGASYVAGRLAHLKQWAVALTWRDVIGLIDVSVSSGGLISGARIRSALTSLGIGGPIESYAIRFAAIATDLVTGREVWLDNGAIDEAVRASIALPGVFSPHPFDGGWLVDGGLVNPVPVSTCRAFGADVTIAVNLNGDLVGRRGVGWSMPTHITTRAPVDEKADASSRLARDIPEALRGQVRRLAEQLLPPRPATPGYFDVLANSVNIMQDRITRSRLAGDPPDVLLSPRLADFNLMDFTRAEDAAAEGRRCVRESLPTILELL